MKTDRLNIRITSELKDELRDQAKREGRSVAGMVTHILVECLAKQKRRVKTDD